jgi:hypothetical protein
MKKDLPASPPSCAFSRKTAPPSSSATRAGSTTRSTALRAAGAALCPSEREDNAPPPMVETAPWGYVRLRLGPTRTKSCNNGAASSRSAPGARPSSTSCTSPPPPSTRRHSCRWRRSISVSREEPLMATEGLKASPGEGLKVYWRPGCSSCVRIKEFLSGLGIEYESITTDTPWRWKVARPRRAHCPRSGSRPHRTCSPGSSPTSRASSAATSRSGAFRRASWSTSGSPCSRRRSAT